ncbi:unnamed protein product [Ectocarpus sp. 12 AP-2014]
MKKKNDIENPSSPRLIFSMCLKVKSVHYRMSRSCESAWYLELHNQRLQQPTFLATELRWTSPGFSYVSLIKYSTVFYAEELCIHSQRVKCRRTRDEGLPQRLSRLTPHAPPTISRLLINVDLKTLQQFRSLGKHRNKCRRFSTS